MKKDSKFKEVLRLLLVVLIICTVFSAVSIYILTQFSV